MAMPGEMSRDGLKVMATRIIHTHGKNNVDMLVLAELLGELLSDDELEALMLVVNEAKVETTITWDDDPKPMPSFSLFAPGTR